MNYRTLRFVLLTLSSLLLCTPLIVHAQWEPDRRLTFDDSVSYTSWNNAWCFPRAGTRSMWSGMTPETGLP